LQFIHYSFFEYLVAEYMADALVRSCVSNSVDVYPYFAKDMPREVRHHLMRIINKTTPIGFGKWLAKGYSAINDTAPNRGREVANNLLVYILGRLREDVSSEIRALLDSEADDLLRTSLYWALCQVVGAKANKEYMEVLRTIAHMRSLNRGYLLYYYGDFNRGQDPPYIDDDPSVSWANTKFRSLQFMVEPNYHKEVTIGRRVLDLYTFYDFCIFRNEVVSIDDGLVLSNVLSIIEQEIGDEDIVRRLREMHYQVMGQPRLFG